MRTWAHVLAAAPLMAGALAATGSPALALGAAAVSVGMDIDHLPDYLWWRGGWRGLGDFFESFHTHRVGRITILLHSWELAPLAALGLMELDWPPWPTWLAAGWLYHLAWDQFTNGSRWRFYCLGFRVRHGFLRARMRQAGGFQPGV